jgi:hypothetical protein
LVDVFHGLIIAFVSNTPLIVFRVSLAFSPTMAGMPPKRMTLDPLYFSIFSLDKIMAVALIKLFVLNPNSIDISIRRAHLLLDDESIVLYILDIGLDLLNDRVRGRLPMDQFVIGLVHLPSEHLCGSGLAEPQLLEICLLEVE